MNKKTFRALLLACRKDNLQNPQRLKYTRSATAGSNLVVVTDACGVVVIADDSAANFNGQQLIVAVGVACYVIASDSAGVKTANGKYSDDNERNDCTEADKARYERIKAHGNVRLYF